MRKFLLFFSFILVLSGIITSCSSSKTYAELLQDENDNIAQLLADSGYHICAFSKDSVYNPAKGSRYFMKLSNGSYLAVISWGDTTKLAVSGTTNIMSRYKWGRILTDGDTAVYSNNSYSSPLDYFYGAASTSFTASSNPVCEALQTPLGYLGDGAKIKIIIPAKISFTDFQSSVKTIYFPYFTYQFY